MDVTVSMQKEPPPLPAAALSHFQLPIYGELVRAYGQSPVWHVAREKEGERVLASWLMFSTPGNYLSPPRSALTRFLDRHIMGLHSPVIDHSLTPAQREHVIAKLLAGVAGWHDRTAPISTTLLLDPALAGGEAELWQRLALRHGFKTEAKWTYLADLPSRAEDLIGLLRPERRTKVRKAQKSGLTFEQDTTLGGLRRYFALRQETLEHNALDALPFAHFEDTLNVMAHSAIFKVFLASLDGRAGAGQLAFVHNGYVHLAGVAVAEWARAARLPANDFLQWSVLEWSIEHGYSRVDFVGAAPHSQDPKLRAIDSFKASWGTKLVSTLQLSRSSLPVRRAALGVLRRLGMDPR